jgi:hypothetical protein
LFFNGDKEEVEMKLTSVLVRVCLVAGLAMMFAVGISAATEDKYSVKVPGGLAFSDFRGYESWQVINVSHGGDKLAVIVGNPTMIKAYQDGIPENGKPFPDGARMAKIHWNAVKNEEAPGPPTVGGPQHDVDFMVKDAKLYADSGGWGYAEFEYDPATQKFRPGTTTDMPPQGNDAKCGHACHSVVSKRDYVFTTYGSR